MATMKAIAFKKPGPAAKSLRLTTVPKPIPEANDILVRLKACAVNPVDTKIREGKFPASEITGYDAAGVIEDVGASVQNFSVGDKVYYSGTLDPDRTGSTAQYSVIDYRLAAHKPKSLSWPEAASLPLVTLTAWEMLEEQFGLVPLPEGAVAEKQSKKNIVIINGAGGVGSLAIQLAAKVFKLGRVIATASRPESVAHVKRMGATHVISHHEPLQYGIDRECGGDLGGVQYVFICHDTNSYMVTAVDIAAPKGKIGSIVEASEPLDGMHDPTAFMKQLSFHWEVMLSKGALGYDLDSQGAILKKAAQLVDEGVLKSVMTENLGALSETNLIKAHEKLESGKTIGKIALEIGDDIE